MKKLLIAGVLFIFQSSAHAQATKCPPIVGFKINKEYYVSNKVVACFKNGQSAKKAGYTANSLIVQYPVEFTGNNNFVTGFVYIYKPSRVTYAYNGTRHFSVVSYFSSGKYGGLLANHIGYASGQGVISEPGTYYLEIEGEGNWNVKVEPLS